MKTVFSLLFSEGRIAGMNCLAAQFLSRRVNIRKHEYGGSARRRAT